MLYDIVEFIKGNKKKCIVILIVLVVCLILFAKFRKDSKKNVLEEGTTIGPPPILPVSMERRRRGSAFG